MAVTLDCLAPDLAPESVAPSCEPLTPCAVHQPSSALDLREFVCLPGQLSSTGESDAQQALTPYIWGLPAPTPSFLQIKG